MLFASVLLHVFNNFGLIQTEEVVNVLVTVFGQEELSQLPEFSLLSLG